MKPEGSESDEEHMHAYRPGSVAKRYASGKENGCERPETDYLHVSRWRRFRLSAARAEATHQEIQRSLQGHLSSLWFGVLDQRGTWALLRLQKENAAFNDLKPGREDYLVASKEHRSRSQQQAVNVNRFRRLYGPDRSGHG